jgi:hypothetical protein
MEAFVAWLTSAHGLHPVAYAIEAHYRLVTIHPFVDGNGRTARLLMNLLLLKHGYPPAIIEKRERLRYVKALETAQTGGPKHPYEQLMMRAAERSLDTYMRAMRGEVPAPVASDQALLKIGELAKQSAVPVPTVRHWVQLGLLEVAEITASGYQLFAKDMISRIDTIQSMQKQRMTLAEIKESLA